MSSQTAQRFAPPTGGRVRGQRQRLKGSSQLGIVIGVDVVLFLFFGLISPGHVFLGAGSFSDIALDASETVLLAVGVAMLLGAGELDISLGANVLLSSVVGGKIMSEMLRGSANHAAVPIAVGVICTLVTGALFGAVNGLAVTRLRVNSFIATLGTLGIGTGLSYVITNGYNISGLPLGLQSGFGIKNVLGHVPLPAVVALVLSIGAYVLLSRTRFGLHTLALGSSREAATRAGVPVKRHLLLVFVLAGGFAGVAAIIDLSRFTTTNLGGHQTDALSAIAGAVIGGTALYGGRVSIGGAVFGSLLAVILQDGLVIQGLQSFYQSIAVGAVLIAAVSIRAFSGQDTSSGRPLLARLRRRSDLTTATPSRPDE